MDSLIESALDAAALRPATDKRALQRVIESAIEEMSPDLYSAQEILEVLIATLRARFYDHDFTEIDWRTQRLVQALQDAHESDPEGYR